VAPGPGTWLLAGPTLLPASASTDSRRNRRHFIHFTTCYLPQKRAQDQHSSRSFPPPRPHPPTTPCEFSDRLLDLQRGEIPAEATPRSQNGCCRCCPRSQLWLWLWLRPGARVPQVARLAGECMSGGSRRVAKGCRRVDWWVGERRRDGGELAWCGAQKPGRLERRSALEGVEEEEIRSTGAGKRSRRWGDGGRVGLAKSDAAACSETWTKDCIASSGIAPHLLPISFQLYFVPADPIFLASETTPAHKPQPISPPHSALRTRDPR
jgi:hypothetical protein